MSATFAEQLDTGQLELTLGQVGGRALRLSGPIVRASHQHAREIVRELGSDDAQSSLAAYWALETRLQQWAQIFARVGREAAQRQRMLEVGSGMGLFTLVGRMLGVPIVGVESSSARYQRSLPIAQALCDCNGQAPAFIQGASEALPLPDRSVDLVASFQTFEHVRDLPQTLREIARVLRPGGLLFAQAPSYAGFYEAHYGLPLPLLLGKRWTRRALRLYRRPVAFLEHLQWLSPPMLRQALDQAGFAQVEVGRPHAAAGGPLPGQAAPPAFRASRGRLSQRLARQLERAGRLLMPGGEHYQQLEIWARR